MEIIGLVVLFEVDVESAFLLADGVRRNIAEGGRGDDGVEVVGGSLSEVGFGGGMFVLDVDIRGI